MRTKRICPRCLGDFWFNETFCGDCGVELVDWTLKCECGAELPPRFDFTFPFPFRRSTYRHCGSCGRDVRKTVSDYARALRRGG